jgi:hypothetical protein
MATPRAETGPSAVSPRCTSAMRAAQVPMASRLKGPRELLGTGSNTARVSKCCKNPA